MTRARSSAVEHYVDIVGVTSSNLVVPTIALVNFMIIRTRSITAINESQFNMWLENFKNNGCPQVLKLGASRVTVSKVEKNKAIVMTLFENKSIIEKIDFKSPKTKSFNDLLKAFGLEDKKTLFVMDGVNKNVYLSARNLKKSEVVTDSEISTYKICLLYTSPSPRD